MWRQFGEDLVFNRKGWLILVGVSLLWQAALWLFATDANAGMMTLLAWIPLVLAPVWSVLSAGMILHRRVLSDETTPKPSVGWKVLLLQVAAVSLQTLAFAGVAALGALLVFRLTLGVPNLLDILPIPDVGWVTDLLVKGAVLGFLFIPALAAATQTAYLFSRLVDGYRTALGVWVFVIVVWGSFRLLPLLTTALAWLPDIPFEELFAVGPAFEFRTVYLDSAPFGAVVLIALGLIAATGPLLHHVESTRDLSLSDIEARSLRRA